MSESSRAQVNDTLLEKALILIAESPSSVSARFLARRVLGLSQVSEPLARKLIKSLVAGEPSVVEESLGRWRLADTPLEYLPLGKLTFTVVDIETTGTSPAGDRITELAAVKVRTGKTIGEFASLVNPDRPVPDGIRRLTGITSDMVRRAPSSRQVMRSFRRFMGSSVFVAHNVGFDWGFVDRELKLFTGECLQVATLCTLQLSRRLFPELGSHKLDAVAERLKIKVRDRHRAQGDARACARILVKFLRLLNSRDVSSLAEVRIFLKTGNVLQTNPHFSFAQLRQLPALPGVYLCQDVSATPIYIAPAKNIHKDVYALFQAQSGFSNRLRRLLRRIAGIRTETLPNFEAAGVQAKELIRQYQPIYNRSRGIPTKRPLASNAD